MKSWFLGSVFFSVLREFRHGKLHFQLHPPGTPGLPGRRAQHLNEILEIDLLEAQLIGEPVGLLGL